MFAESSITLTFLSDDESQQQLARDYWAAGQNGRTWTWAENVEKIARRYALEKRMVAAMVRQVATASNPDVRCEHCQSCRQFTSRDEFLRLFRNRRHKFLYVCDNCRAAQERTAAEERARQRTAQTKQQNAVIAREVTDAHKIDYGSVHYLSAVLLYAIMLSSDQACEAGKLDDPQEIRLCANRELTGELLAGLFDEGILQFSPEMPASAIVIEAEGRWSYFPLQVKWLISPPINAISYTKLFAELGTLIDLQDKHPDYVACVSELWWRLGVCDALSFLNREVEGFGRGHKWGPKLQEAISYALERFSIPQVRRVIRYVTKESAALYAKRTYTLIHSLNIVPGAIIRYVDRAISDKWTVHPILLGDYQKDEPELHTLLFNRVIGSGMAGFTSTTGAEVGRSIHSW